MTNSEIARLLADENGDLVARDEAITYVGTEKLEPFATEIAKLLKHPHTMLRGAAIKSLVLYWEKAEFVPTAIAMMNEDPEAFVRRDALAALTVYGQIHEERREEIIFALANVVARELHPPLRRAAYNAIGKLISSKVSLPLLTDGFAEEDLRWDILNPFLPAALRREVGR